MPPLLRFLTSEMGRGWLPHTCILRYDERRSENRCQRAVFLFVIALEWRDSESWTVMSFMPFFRSLYFRYLVKKEVSLSKGISFNRSYRSTCPTPGTMKSSFGSAASR